MLLELVQTESGRGGGPGELPRKGVAGEGLRAHFGATGPRLEAGVALRGKTSGERSDRQQCRVGVPLRGCSARCSPAGGGETPRGRSFGGDS